MKKNFFKNIQGQDINDMPQGVREVVGNLQVMNNQIGNHYLLAITDLYVSEHDRGYLITFEMFNTFIQILIESDCESYAAKDTELTVTYFTDNHEELSSFKYRLNDGVQGFISRFKNTLWPHGRMITTIIRKGQTEHLLDHARLRLFGD